MREVIIDFEGCLQGGIREIGIIETSNLEVVRTWDVTISRKEEVRELLLKVFEQKPNYLVAHNAQIEKNLIKDHLPYPALEKGEGKKGYWGPWLDTLDAYRALYPTIKDYSLKYLSSVFLRTDHISKLADELCNQRKRRAHFALYDATCTFLLVKRISRLVDLQGFIK